MILLAALAAIAGAFVLGYQEGKSAAVTPPADDPEANDLPATVRQRAYARKLIRQRPSLPLHPDDADDPALTIDSASALIDRLKETPRETPRRPRAKVEPDPLES